MIYRTIHVLTCLSILHLVPHNTSSFLPQSLNQLFFCLGASLILTGHIQQSHVKSHLRESFIGDPPRLLIQSLFFNIKPIFNSLGNTYHCLIFFFLVYAPPLLEKSDLINLIQLVSLVPGSTNKQTKISMPIR